jgi:hypothetical protein
MHDYDTLLLGLIVLAITFSGTMIYIRRKETKKH